MLQQVLSKYSKFYRPYSLSAYADCIGSYVLHTSLHLLSTRFSHRPLNPNFRIFATFFLAFSPKKRSQKRFAPSQIHAFRNAETIAAYRFSAFPKNVIFPKYYVMGQTRLSCLGQKSLSSAGLVKRMKVSFPVRTNACLSERKNAAKYLFSSVFSMSIKKTPAELLPSRSFSSMRLRMAQLA